MFCNDIWFLVAQYLTSVEIYTCLITSLDTNHNMIDYLHADHVSAKQIIQWCSDNCKYMTLEYLLSEFVELDLSELAMNKAVENGCLKTVQVLLKDERIPTFIERKCTCSEETWSEYPYDGCLQCWEEFEGNYGSKSTETGPLHIASLKNNLQMVKLLLSCPRVSPMNPENLPLLAAIKNQNVEIVKLLLAEEDTDIQYCEDDPLYEALAAKNSEILIMLFQHPKFAFDFISASTIMEECANIENSEKVLATFDRLNVKK